MPNSLAFMLLAATGSTLQAGTSDPAASLLRAAPQSTVVALVCDDVPGLVDGLRAGPLGALWRDEAMASARASVSEELWEMWEQEVFPGGPQGGELLLGVEAAAFFMGELEGEEPSGGAFVLALRDELAHELAGSLAADDPDAERIVLGDLELHLSRLGDGEFLASGEWLRGVVFGLSSDRQRALDWAHEVVRGLDAEPSAVTPRGAEFLARRSSAAALEGHADLGALFASIVNEADPEAREAFESLGLDRLGWSSISFAAGGDGSLGMRGDIELPPDGLLAQWMSLMRPAPLALGRLAPHDAIEVGFLGFDADALWRGVEAFVAELDPGGPDGEAANPAQLLEQRMDEIEALLGIDLREALFENLSGEFARFVLPDAKAYAHAPESPLALVDLGLTYMSGVLPQVGAVHVVGLRDGAAMEELVDALIGLAGADGSIVEEQVGAHWVQSVDLSDLPFAGLSPCWVVLDDALVLSGGLPSLRAVLAQLDEHAPASWLEDEERTRRARELVAEGGCGVAVADAAALFERRVERPLRECLALMDSETTGSTVKGFLNEVVPAPDDGDGDAGEHVRDVLGQALAAARRLREDHLNGALLSLLAWSGRSVAYRVWTEPAQRD